MIKNEIVRAVSNSIFKLQSMIFKSISYENLNINNFTYSSKKFFLKEGAIFPGTNWCGAGTIAEEYSKLGSYGGADKCCRQHDLGCPAFIRSGHTKYGLYNYKMWTLNHCTCDER